MESCPINPRTPRRWRRRFAKALLFTFLALAALWLVTLAVATVQYHRAAAALKARGQPTTYEDTVRRNEELFGTGRNELLQRAITEHVSTGQPGINSFRAVRAPFKPSTEAERSEWKAAVATAAGVLGLLEQAVERPPTPLARTAELHLLHGPNRDRRTIDVRALHLLAALDLRLALDELDWPRAARRIRLLLGLADQLSADPFLTPQGVRLEMINVTAELVIEVSQTAAFTATEFTDLDRRLHDAERGFKLAPALRTERLKAAEVTHGSANTNDLLRQQLLAQERAADWVKFPMQLARRVWAEAVISPLGLPVRRKGAAETLACPDDVLELVDAPPPRPEEVAARFDRWKKALNPSRLAVAPPPNSMLEVAEEIIRKLHRRLVLARLALRLRRYHLQHRRLPDTLTEICNAAMSEIPLTWFEGEPFCYTRDGLKCRVAAPERLLHRGGWTDDDSLASYGLLLKLDYSARPWNVELAP